MGIEGQRRNAEARRCQRPEFEVGDDSDETRRGKAVVDRGQEEGRKGKDGLTTVEE